MARDLSFEWVGWDSFAEDDEDRVAALDLDCGYLMVEGPRQDELAAMRFPTC